MNNHTLIPQPWNFRAPVWIRNCACLFALVLFMAEPGEARAATKKFDGGISGTGHAWATANNWNPDGRPASGDDIVMDTTHITIPEEQTASTSISVRSIEFMNNFAANNTWHL
ncbi:MAG TPA: hypothetical protein P5205_21655, partial [Candidatus Paceibacterota bacterium]|nr:hypothetical protein [Verrucomicrobiota bacterium]HSA12969.1 hypothetical protein [Candidatus Paceibacterota bacterium]